MAKGFVESNKGKRPKYFGDISEASAGGARRRAGKAEEGRLVRAAQGGDPAALRRLLALVSRPAFRYGMTFCRDTEDAEEIAQDVLSSLVRSLARYRGEGTLSTWAYAVARNACMRRRRRAKDAALSLDEWRENGGAEPAGPARDDPHAAVERAEIREAVAAAVAALPATLREAVILRDVEGLSAREAAAVLKVSERALKSRLHRARASLRARLQPIVTGEEPKRRSRGCPDIARSWSLHVEREVSPATCARLEAHVRRCPECAAVCKTMRTTLRACRLLRARGVPRAARVALRGALDASRTMRAARG